jgi:hypothetical protein
LGGRPKWLVTISLHCDLLAVYDTKLQIIHQYGFLLWEPLLYNGGLRVLGCSYSGEALATPEPLISSPICSSEANEELRLSYFCMRGPAAVAGFVLSCRSEPRVDVCWCMCLVSLGTCRFCHSWFLLSNGVNRSAYGLLWSAPRLLFLPHFSLDCWLWRRVPAVLSGSRRVGAGFL